LEKKFGDASGAVPLMSAHSSPAGFPSIRKRRFLLSLVWILIGLWVALCIVQGVRVRRWTYDTFDALRFHSDLQRRCMWGLECIGPEGFLNQYEKMAIEEPDWRTFLDYSPLRLLVVREWAIYLQRHFPEITDVPAEEAYDRAMPPEDRNSGSPEQLKRSLEFQFPLLCFGALLDLIGAISAFFLTRLWVRRTKPLTTSSWLLQHLHGTWQGLIAATLFWFNPNTLLNAYGWPTWDTWIVPMFLLAALLSSLDYWFCSGLVLATGMMLKGQQLAVVPVFILWALISGGLGPTSRWIIGLVLGVGLIVSPWMITYLPPEKVQAARLEQSLPAGDWSPTLFAINRMPDWPAMTWIYFTAAVVAAAMYFRHKKWHIAAGAAAVFILAYWPWLLRRNREWWAIGVLCAAALSASTALVPRRGQWFSIAAIFGGGLLLCMLIFHGSTAWWLCAFHFPSIQAPFLIYGPASNIPGIFELRFGWPPEIDAVAFTLPALIAFSHGWFTHLAIWPAAPLAVTSGTLFDSIYFILLILSGIGIGLHARRHDPRFLVALVTPWLMFFLFPVRLHERYLLFAAATASICIGHGLGMTLLGFVLTVASSVMTLDQMWGNDLPRWGSDLAQQFPSIFSPDAGLTIQSYVQNTHPDIGWGVLVAAMVFFYLTMMPSPKALRKAKSLLRSPPQV
jgi:hypothetical protein